MNMMMRSAAPYQVKIYDFKPGDRIEDKGVILKWMGNDPKGYWFQRIDDDLPEELFTFEFMSRRFDDKRDPMGFLPRRHSQVGNNETAGGTELISNLRPPQQADVLFKHAWCIRFLLDEKKSQTLPLKERVSRSDSKMKKYIAETQAELERAAWEHHKSLGKTAKTFKQIPTPPPSRTLREWVLKLERANFDPIALLNNNSARYRRDYFTPDELEHINEYVWMRATSGRLPIKDLHERLGESIKKANAERTAKNAQYGAEVLSMLRCPDIDTFSARIHKLPRAHVELGHYGADYALAKNRSIMTGIDIVRPLERIEIDESVIDMHTLFIQAEEWDRLTAKEREMIARIRLYVTAAIDVATKSIVGLRIHHSKPNAVMGVSVLEMATQDKTEIAKSLGCETPWDQHGVYGEVAADSATWYASTAFHSAVTDIGGCFFQPKAGDAAARGTIERWFRTLNRQALIGLTGRTWGSIEEKGNTDSQKQATVLFQHLALIVHRYLVDLYHNTPNGGPYNESPRDAWERLKKIYKPSPPLSDRMRRDVFGIKMTRKITRNGIRVLGIQYNSSKLQKLFRDAIESDLDVEVKLDRRNLGAISVCYHNDWFPVDAVHDEFKGMSLWTWLAFNERLRLRNRKNAKINIETVRRTKAWLREQAEVAQAAAELGSNVLTERDIIRFEKNVAYSVDFIEKSRRPEAAEPVEHEEDISSFIDRFDILGVTQAYEDAEAKQQPTPTKATRRKKRPLKVAPPSKPETSEKGGTLLDPKFDF